MSDLRRPPFSRREKDPISVEDTSRGRVPFLRPLDWMATALKTFRERPLPASYETTAQPTFDLFGNAGIASMEFATVLGTLGNREAFHSVVPEGFYRFYQSMEYFHDDPVARELRGGLIFHSPTIPAFPFVALVADQAVAADIPFVLRNFTVQPGARAAARVSPAINVASRITLNLLWVELRVGEPHGDIS